MQHDKSNRERCKRGILTRGREPHIQRLRPYRNESLRWLNDAPRRLPCPLRRTYNPCAHAGRAASILAAATLCPSPSALTIYLSTSKKQGFNRRKHIVSLLCDDRVTTVSKSSHNREAYVSHSVERLSHEGETYVAQKWKYCRTAVEQHDCAAQMLPSLSRRTVAPMPIRSRAEDRLPTEQMTASESKP